MYKLLKAIYCFTCKLLGFKCCKKKCPHKPPCPHPHTTTTPPPVEPTTTLPPTTTAAPVETTTVPPVDPTTTPEPPTTTTEAPVVTTTTDAPTTAAPPTTTVAPVPTTVTPVPTTVAPVPTTVPPVVDNYPLNFFTSTINGSQQIAPTNSEAFGVAVFIETAQGLEYSMTVVGMEITAVKFHRGPMGSAGMIVKNVDVDPVNGTYNGIWKYNDEVQPMTEVLMGEAHAGNLYVVFYSDAFPGGEVRGQIFAC